MKYRANQQWMTRCFQHVVRSVCAMFAMLLVTLMVFGMVLPVQAFADDNNDMSSGDTSIVIGDNIIDSENLLGSNLNRVNDAITQVQQQTGVRMQLMYIPTFADNGNPQKWAEQYLRNTEVPKNTVFMAVASQDGNVVVVVSEGSDAWLSNADTVNRLSDAALAPLTQETPDWSGAAIALANAIIAEKHPSFSQWVSRHARLLWITFGIVLVLLLIIGVVLFKKFYKTPAQRQLERRRRRKARQIQKTSVSSQGPEVKTVDESNSDRE